MKLNESMPIKGKLHIQLFGPDGQLKEERRVHNLVVTAGKNFVADQLSGTPGTTKMTHMAVGTGTTGAAAGDTQLETETDRNALTSSVDTANALLFVGDWAAGDATATITEAGIFNNSSGGTMLARATFTGIAKGALDVLKINWTVTFGQAVNYSQ